MHDGMDVRACREDRCRHRRRWVVGQWAPPSHALSMGSLRAERGTEDTKGIGRGLPTRKGSSSGLVSARREALQLVQSAGS